MKSRTDSGQETGTEIKMIKPNSILMDRRIQRPLDTKRVDRIVAEFDREALGVQAASEREAGSYFCLDGQHRTEALKLLGLGDHEFPYETYKGLSLADEATIFRLRNNTRAPQYIDKFRVRRIEGDPVANAISDIITRNGWTIADTLRTRAGQIVAVQAMERVYITSRGLNQDPNAIESALATSTHAWGVVPYAGDGRILEGLGLIFVRYGDTLDREDLINRLKPYPAGPGGLIGKARGLRDLTNVKLPAAVAEIVVELYNQRRKTSAVPSWRSF